MGDPDGRLIRKPGNHVEFPTHRLNQRPLETCVRERDIGFVPPLIPLLACLLACLLPPTKRMQSRFRSNANKTRHGSRQFGLVVHSCLCKKGFLAVRSVFVCLFSRTAKSSSSKRSHSKELFLECFTNNRTESVFYPANNDRVMETFHTRNLFHQRHTVKIRGWSFFPRIHSFPIIGKGREDLLSESRTEDNIKEAREAIVSLAAIGDWCNGSTAASGAVSLGSNPRSPTRFIGVNSRTKL